MISGSSEYHTGDIGVLLSVIATVFAGWKATGRDKDSIYFVRNFGSGVEIYCGFWFHEARYELGVKRYQLSDYVGALYGLGTGRAVQRLVPQPVEGRLRFVEEGGYNLVKARTDAKRLRFEGDEAGKQMLSSVKTFMLGRTNG